MAKDGTNRGGARPGAGRPRKNPDGTTEHASFTAEQLKALVDSPMWRQYQVNQFLTQKPLKKSCGENTAME